MLAGPLRREFELGDLTSGESFDVAGKFNEVMPQGRGAITSVAAGWDESRHVTGDFG